MNSAFYTSTRLFLKRAWVGALFAVGTLVLVPLFFRVVFHRSDAGVDPHALFSMHFFYLAASWLFFLAVCFYAIQGTQKICMGLPVRSSAIVTWMMLATAGLAVLLQLVTNGAYRLLFFDRNWLTDYWPLLGPLLFLVTLILVCHTIYWGLYAISFTRIVCWTVALVGLFWWFVSRYFPDGYRMDAVSWNQVTLPEFLSLSFVGVFAWYLGTKEFARVRAGIAVPSARWQAMRDWWEETMSGGVSQPNKNLVSVESSFAKLHWRDSCQRVVITYGTLFGATICVVNLSMMPLFGSTFLQCLDGFLAITLILGLIAAVLSGIQIGEGLCVSGRTEMKPCLAGIPLSDTAFQRTLFRNLVKAMLVLFLMVQAGLLFSFLTLVLLKGPDVLGGDVVQTAGLILKYSFYYACGFWIIQANLISLLWTGRTRFIYTVIGGGLGLFGLFVGMLSFLESASPHLLGSSTVSVFERFLMLVFLGLSLLIFGGTAHAYRAAFRRELISLATCLTALVLWGLGIFLAFLFYVTIPGSPREVVECCFQLFLIAVCSLSLTPLATVPLAVAWNRHR